VTGDADEVMFRNVKMPFQRNFYSVEFRKGENAEVMFWVGEWRLELINCLLDVLKNDFVEVNKTMI
jgi:hypothetical protein